jgi:hypothetical protein
MQYIRILVGTISHLLSMMLSFVLKEGNNEIAPSSDGESAGGKTGGVVMIDDGKGR